MKQCVYTEFVPWVNNFKMKMKCFLKKAMSKVRILDLHAIFYKDAQGLVLKVSNFLTSFYQILALYILEYFLNFHSIYSAIQVIKSQ